MIHDDHDDDVSWVDDDNLNWFDFVDDHVMMTDWYHRMNHDHCVHNLHK